MSNSLSLSFDLEQWLWLSSCRWHALCSCCHSLEVCSVSVHGSGSCPCTRVLWGWGTEASLGGGSSGIPILKHHLLLSWSSDWASLAGQCSPGICLPVGLSSSGATSMNYHAGLFSVGSGHVCEASSRFAIRHPPAPVCFLFVGNRERPGT